nr:immunoglobulin light chain junction region [Macaca mulatta]
DYYCMIWHNSGAFF